MAKDRKIGVALDFSRGSKLALEWAVDNLLYSGDTLYVIHVNPPQGGESRHLLWSNSGSRNVLYWSKSKVLCFLHIISRMVVLMYWFRFLGSWMQLWFPSLSYVSGRWWKSMRLKLIPKLWVCLILLPGKNRYAFGFSCVPVGVFVFSRVCDALEFYAGDGGWKALLGRCKRQALWGSRRFKARLFGIG